MTRAALAAALVATLTTLAVVVARPVVVYMATTTPDPVFLGVVLTASAGTALAVVAVLRSSGHLPPYRYGSGWVAAYLADRSWHHEQLRQAIEAYYLEVARFYVATAVPVHDSLWQRGERGRPGMDVIRSRRWTQPASTDRIGRPPMARRTPGATLIGAPA